MDLAEAIVKIILSENQKCFASSLSLGSEIVNLQSKIFHFSNEGQCSWYDFAKKIFEINNIEIDLQPIPTTGYPTPAKRPKYSVLDKSKIKTVFSVEVRNWEDSLKRTHL